MLTVYAKLISQKHAAMRACLLAVYLKLVYHDRTVSPKLIYGIIEINVQLTYILFKFYVQYNRR
jgi:hypothetical protein